MGKLINKYECMLIAMRNREIEQAFLKSKKLDKTKVKDFVVPDYKLINDQKKEAE